MSDISPQGGKSVVGKSVYPQCGRKNGDEMMEKTFQYLNGLLYDTDGSVGAAKGAGIGAGVYKDNNEAFATLEKLEVIEPDVAQRTAYDDAYARWKSNLERAMAAF